MLKRLLMTTLGAALVLIGTVPLGAHDDAPKPTAQVAIVPDGGLLTVVARVPAVALLDANLPTNADGSLDPARLDAALQLVARDVASTFEFAQNGEPLAAPIAKAALTSDRSAVDLALTYVIVPDGGPLSARLHTFHASPDPVPTRVRFVASADQERTFVVTGDPEVVVFDPRPAEALRQFATRGARVVAGGWDMLLFALALLFPMRQAIAHRRHVATLLSAEVLGALGAAAGILSAISIEATLTGAASVATIAALLSLVYPASRWMTPLSTAFGLLNGVAVGVGFSSQIPYAGSHAVVAFSALVVTILIAQVWLFVLLSSARDLLRRFGLPATATAIAVLVVVCHSALHQVAAHAAIVEAFSEPDVDWLLRLLVVAWAATILLCALLSARRTRLSAA